MAKKHNYQEDVLFGYRYMANPYTHLKDYKQNLQTLITYIKYCNKNHPEVKYLAYGQLHHNCKYHLEFQDFKT